MLKEVISYLQLKPGYAVLDSTAGGGGHAVEILKRITPGGRLIGIDADPNAVRLSEESLKDFKNYKLVNENFRNLDRVLSRENIKVLNAALFDLGISSDQLEDRTRGFAFSEDSALDMRMDPKSNITAYDIVNKLKEKELADIIEKFGEERFARRIARFIAEKRLDKAIATTRELAEIIRKAIGYRYKRGRIDPATRTFQAIRIAVNDELNAIEEGIKKAVSWLDIGGRIVVISFHSLEDRIVKNLFKGYSGLGILKIITKKPVTPGSEELNVNYRSRSGKLRVAERV